MNALTNERRWANWFLHQDPNRKKPSKVPTRPTDQPESWLSFEEARRRDPLHLAFLLGDGWAGVDVDDIEVNPQHAAKVLDSFKGAYIEPSISGHGMHVIGRAPRIGLEFDYDSPRGEKPLAWKGARFFVTTLQGTGDPTLDISSILDAWCPRDLAAEDLQHTGYALADQLTDDEVLMEAAGSANGDKFLALWRGDFASLGYKSGSEADLALCCILAFWTNNNPERIDRLFRLSNLMRPKWEVNSYREATIRKAVSR